MIGKLFMFSLHSLRARKLRSWLTVLGIVIGVAAVIGLMLVGQGLQNAIAYQFEKAGANKIYIMSGRGTAFGGLAGDKLTEHDLDVVRKVRGVEKSGGMSAQYTKIEFKKEEQYSFIVSLPEEMSPGELMGVDMEEGRVLRRGEDSGVIIGYSIAQGDFFEKEVGVGDSLVIKGKEFRVVGILGQVGNPQDDSQVYMTSDAFKIAFGQADYSAIVVLAREGDDTRVIAEDIKEKMRKDRDLKKGKEDFSVQTFEQLMNTFSSILSVVNLAIVGIAAISLIVGGVGIMNTMYTSIIERTKQIGVMKAVGAKDKHILSIFILEAGIIGFVGGLIGAAAGFSFAKIIELVAASAGFMMLKVNFDFAIIGFGLAFALGIGVVAGFLPARQASNLDPVEALRWG